LPGRHHRHLDPTIDGACDRALIDVMTYAVARIGAVATARARTQTGRLPKQTKHRLLPVLRVETSDAGGNMPWKGIGVAIAIIVASLIVLGRASGFLVDWAWFSTIGYVGVFWTVFATKAVLFTAVFAVSTLLLWVNGTLALRFASQRRLRLHRLPRFLRAPPGSVHASPLRLRT